MAGSISFENPEPGEPRSSSDGKIRTGLVKLKEAINGGLNAENVVAGSLTDATLANPNNSAYRAIISAAIAVRTELGAGTYILGSGFVPVGSGGNLFGGTGFLPPLFYFASEDYAVTGKTQKLRLRAQAAVNATKAAIKCTFGLYPITVAGGAGELKITLGTVVTGSTLEINEPAASTVTQAVNSDFTIPSNGAYALGVVTSATLTANSAAQLVAQLQTRSV